MNGGFICVGWHEFGDMREQTDEAAFRERYRELHPQPQSFRQWKEIWGFAKEIREGDIVVANNGMTSIVGIGRVTGDYYYDTNRSEYKHCLPVDWEMTTEYPIPEAARDVVKNWFQGTVKQLGREEYQKLLNDTVKKLVWRRSSQYGFDLVLTNPDAFDAPFAKDLFTHLLDAPKPKGGAINEHIRDELGAWLNDLSGKLPSSAYVGWWCLWTSQLIRNSCRAYRSGSVKG
jgi:hypothetical protein